MDCGVLYSISYKMSDKYLDFHNRKDKNKRGTKKCTKKRMTAEYVASVNLAN